MNNTKVLLVEDDLTLQNSLAYILEKEGYQVLRCMSGEKAVELAREHLPDLILLDLVLPGIDGFDVCRIIRNDTRTAAAMIIMLSGRSLPADIIRGLESMADDYVTKPFDPRVLNARIRAVMRRKNNGRGRPVRRFIEWGPIKIDLQGYEVFRNSQKINLTRSEFALLVCLARRPNIVLSRMQLLNCMGAIDSASNERTVDYQIWGLRKKLGTAAICIETVRGVGYKFHSVDVH